MLSNRILPVLVLSGEGVIKTKKFVNYKYLGDPINIVKIYNEKKVDELVIFDINATKLKKINYKLIQKISRQCRMPLCYGGGVSNIDEAKKILSLGVEKISFSSLFFKNNDGLKEIINHIGSQSVVITLDFKPTIFGRFNFYTDNGKKKLNIDTDTIINRINEISPGEVILNSIKNDGMKCGYDLNILKLFSKKITLPITMSGGAKNIDSFIDAFRINPSIGFAASSIFSLKGKLDAVLIQYLSQAEREQINKLKL